VYLFAFLLDYWLGYLFVMRPLLAKSTLIVFDRYFHDLLVDPLRYRYGGPLWLARVLSRLIPPPDLLFLVLDASEEIILSRKQELPTGEVRRLRSEYQTLANTSSSATLVKTDDGLEKTVAGASDVIAAYMASRFRRQHPYWFASARNEQ
jgi:thymidylate kinase